jgi:hypothetical protein
VVLVIKGVEGKGGGWDVLVVVVVKNDEIVGPVRMWRRGSKG